MLGFGSQAFICGFSRQNICSVLQFGWALENFLAMSKLNTITIEAKFNINILKWLIDRCPNLRMLWNVGTHRLGYFPSFLNILHTFKECHDNPLIQRLLDKFLSYNALNPTLNFLRGRGVNSGNTLIRAEGNFFLRNQGRSQLFLFCKLYPHTSYSLKFEENHSIKQRQGQTVHRR